MHADARGSEAERHGFPARTTFGTNGAAACSPALHLSDPFPSHPRGSACIPAKSLPAVASASVTPQSAHEPFRLPRTGDPAERLLGAAGELRYA